MDTAVPLASLVVAVTMVIFAAFNFKSQKDDIRQKAEISYVQSVEQRLQNCQANETSLRQELETERRGRQQDIKTLTDRLAAKDIELNELRTDVIELTLELRDVGVPPRSRGAPRGRRRPRVEDEEEEQNG